MLGKKEIATMLDVPVRTVHTWANRDVLPPPDVRKLNGSAAWFHDSIMVWAHETNRLPGVASFDNNTEIPLGQVEVAALLGVEVETVKKWRHRNLLPAAVGEVNGLPVWRRHHIIAWADSTGRRHN